MSTKRRYSGGNVSRKAYRAGGFRLGPLSRSSLWRRRLFAGRRRARLSGRTAHKETGYVDLGSANYNLDTTGSIALVNTVAQGASVNQRIGKKYRLKSFQIRGFVQANTTATTCEGAILLVYDKRPTGALPGITDILVSANSKAFANDANSDRFFTLRRLDYVFAGNPAAPTAATLHDIEEYVKCNRPVVCKAAGTGAIGDIAEGAVYILSVGTQAAGATAAQATLDIRVRFVDE